MFAQALARRLSRAGIHYGWAIVAIIFFLALTTAGCMGISGALIVPLTKEFGWSTEQISVALALRIVLFGLMAPFTAALIDKYGFKSVVLVALGLIEIGLLGALVMTQALASGAVLGRHRRLRHGPYRHGAGRSGCNPLVYRAARTCGRHSQRFQRLRPTPAAAARGVARRPLRLARRALRRQLWPWSWSRWSSSSSWSTSRRTSASSPTATRATPRPMSPLRRHSAAPSRSCSNQPAARRSGCWRARSSSAVSAPMASFRPISSPSAATTACRRSRRLRRWR